MNRFTPNPYRTVLATQLRDFAGALPDAVAALMLIAAIGCACLALDPSAPVHGARAAVSVKPVLGPGLKVPAEELVR